MSLPSDKYKKQLLTIKKRLMNDIAQYFEYGKFEMSSETAIKYLVPFGTFDARFDTIVGCEMNFKLYLKERNFITVIGFDANEYVEIENDIPFLMKLLDYVDMDYRNSHNGNR